MAGKSRTGKGKTSPSRKPRNRWAPAAKTSASGQISLTQHATSATTPMMPRRRGAPVITDLNAATAARYPYVVRELKLVGIMAAIVVVLLIVLFFTLS